MRPPWALGFRAEVVELEVCHKSLECLCQQPLVFLRRFLSPLERVAFPHLLEPTGQLVLPQ